MFRARYGVFPSPEHVAEIQEYDDEKWFELLRDDLDLLVFYYYAITNTNDLKTEEKIERVKMLSTDQGFKFPPLKKEQREEQKKMDIVEAEVCLLSENQYEVLSKVIYQMRSSIGQLLPKDGSEEVVFNV